MKLRIEGDSVRLRLRRSEVERLAVEGRLAVRVNFGNAGERQLEYSLELDPLLTSARADFEGDAIRVRVPRSQGLAWCAGTDNRLAFDQTRPTVLVEKDYVRSAVVESDDHDRYENARTGRKPPPPPPARLPALA